MTRSRKRKLARNRAKWAGMPLASAILASGGAYGAAETDQATLEEVVVTAQKRTEDLQKVPISLQVLGSEKLEQLQVTQFDDYAKFLPSLSFKSIGPGQAELFFRGISSGGGTLHAGFLPSSGLYLDDIPVTTVAGSLDLHVYDIARVEALAGPQGTLYGASSLSGTLRIITNKPDPSGFSAAYDVKADKWGRGNGGGGIEGYVNIPLSEHAAIRLVGYYEHDGGYINNVYRTDTYQRIGFPVVAGGPPTGVATATPDNCPTATCPITVNNANAQKSHYNDVDSIGGRAALKVDLNDQWSITPTVIAQHQRTHGDFGFDPKLGDLNVADYFLPRNLDRWYQSELTVEGKISNWDLVYSGGWFERKVDNLVDYAQYTIGYDQLAIANSYSYTRFADSAGNLIDPSQYTRNKDKYTKMSHELRLSSPAENRFRATTGLFYQRQTDDIRAEFNIPNLPVYYQVTGQKDVYYLSQQDRTDRDYAVFGEGTFDVTDKLKLTAGIREFWVSNTLYGFFGFGQNVTNYGFSSSGEGLCLAQGNPIVTTPGVYTGGNRPCVDTDKKVIEHGETHKINLTYQLTPDVMVYGTWSTGFRPGGNNRKPAAGSWKADTLANFEVGWKTAWFDHRLRVNGAVFYEKWKDVQTSVQGASGITSIVNAGDARVEGIESDVSWAVDEHLTLSVSATGLLRAEITSTFCAPTRDGQVQFGCTAPGDIDATAGTQLPVTPKVKGSGTARYAFNLGDYKSFVQGSVIHQSATTYSLENTRFLAGDTPSFTTFDFSAGTSKDNWHLEAFIENAFDKRGQLGKLSECNDSAGYCLSNAKVYPIRPMQIGVKFGQKF
jgi:iron complex outermembrane receptor protein